MKCSIFVSAILIGTLILAGFGCLVSPFVAPSPQPPVSSYPTLSRISPLSENKTGWTTFTTENGLSENCTTSVIQDKQGVLWVASFDKGITRFDGLDWVKYTDFPQDVKIYASTRDKQGNLWFGTDSGAYEYTGKEWRNFTIVDTKSYCDNIVHEILADNQGNMWFNAEDDCGHLGPGFYGVTRYNGNVWTTFLQSGGMGTQVTALFQDRENNIWVGTNRGVFRYNGTDWQNFTTKDGLAGYSVIAIAQDAQDNMWFGTQAQGTIRYDGKNWRTFSVRDGLIGSQMQCMLKDNKGNMWFGAYAAYDGTGNGVSCFDGTHWQNFNPWPNLNWWPNFGRYNVISIFQDDEGNIWFSTTEGLVRYTPD
jgi:ligand-binding sensor domain-containing protein